MRFATIVDDGDAFVAIVSGQRVLPLVAAEVGHDSLRSIAAGGRAALDRVRAWAERQPARAYRALDDVPLGPVVPDPGAIYAIGRNYREPGEAQRPATAAPDRPLVYAKAPTSVAGSAATLTWDRGLTANVDAEVELGVVIGEPAWNASPDEAAGHVFGYTIVNDVSSRDPWLDGDQWLLGKSMPGFCPVGPWVVTTDELDPADLRLGCRINGEPIQDGRTSQMRLSIARIIAFLSRHVVLRPGDLIATGTPARLADPPGPERHLRAGDRVTCWIEGIGELTTRID